MIKVKAITKEYGPYLHPVQTGTNGVIYSLNHQMGTRPPIVEVQLDWTGGGNFTRAYDFYAVSGTYYQWSEDISSTDNTTAIKFYRISSSSRYIKIKLMWL